MENKNKELDLIDLQELQESEQAIKGIYEP